MSPSDSAPSARRSAGWLVLWLGLGLALRLILAWAERGSAREWEAEGFVRAWEGWGSGDVSGMRPAGFNWLMAAVGQLAGSGDLLGLRLACAGLSLASLAAGWVLVVFLAGSVREPPASAWTACTWLTAIWAMSPTLVEVGVRPLPELAVSGALCLVLAAAVAWGGRPGPARWLLLASALAAALLLGGLIVALAVLVAVLVYLAPLPRLPVALSVLVAVLAAGTCAWLAQSGPAGTRRFAADAAPAFGLAALADASFLRDGSLPIDPQRRDAFVVAAAWRAARAQGAVRVAAAVGRRLIVDQLGPARLEHLGWATLPAALLDAFLRGGALVLAAATLRLLRRGEEASLPRAALLTGVLVLGVLAVAGATSPFALGPLDLLVAAVAAVGLARGRPLGARIPRFALGGAVLAALVASVALTRQQPSEWSQRLTHQRQQGSRLVALLSGAGPQDVAGHGHAVVLLADPAAPFQRLPDAARRHAEAGVALAPDDQQALLALVQADLENLEFERARSLVSTLVGGDGLLLPQARVLMAGIADQERRLRAERLP